MHDKKYQIFVSSTKRDLEEEREAVVSTILKMGHIPIGMEMFNASNASQWAVIQKTIDTCDYYVVVVAKMYGSTIAEEGGISYTEKEFNYAKQKGIPVLGFVIHDDAAIAAKHMEQDPEKIVRLKQFVEKIGMSMWSRWKTKDDLRAEVSTALPEAFVTSPREGWVRASNAANAGTMNELARLSAENQVLRNKLTTLGDIDFDKLCTSLSSIRITQSGFDLTLLYLFTHLSPKLRRTATLSSLSDDMFKLRSHPGVPVSAPSQDSMLLIVRDIVEKLDMLGLIQHSVEVRESNSKVIPGPVRVDIWQLSETGMSLYREISKRKLLAADAATNTPL